MLIKSGVIKIATLSCKNKLANLTGSNTSVQHTLNTLTETLNRKGSSCIAVYQRQKQATSESGNVELSLVGTVTNTDVSTRLGRCKQYTTHLHQHKVQFYNYEADSKGFESPTRPSGLDIDTRCGQYWRR